MKKSILTLLTAFSPFILLGGSSEKKARSVRVPDPPTIDAVLNEPVWQAAPVITEFTQYDPIEGNPPSERTEIRILYDDEALYIGAMMYDSEPDKIVARLARRDDEVEADFISFRIDSYHDHQTAFEFTVNAAGVKTDILQYNDAREEDASWDAVWDVETLRTGDGWITELKIPFRTLRFSEAPEQEWGFQVIRYISRKRERLMWVLIRRSESGFVSKFGHLTGISGVPTPKNIQLLPYSVGSTKFLQKSTAFPDGRDLSANVGFDLKYVPAGSFSIDATFNPDFGQVEADPAVLNLTTIETFYPEKRPFFIEGTQIFRFSTFGGEFGPGMFYSRRIGKALDVEAAPGHTVLSAPSSASILGAAKISGKTSSGFSVGVVEAVTQEERATFADPSGRRYEQIVEPFANYSVVRVQQDVLQNSYVGAILTSVAKRERLPASTVGLDWNLKFDENVYRIGGFVGGSRTTQFGERIDGSAGRLSFNKEGGPHWRGFVSFDYTTKRYNINDIGFFRRPNDWGQVSQILYRNDQVTDWKRIYNLSALYHTRWNFDGVELFNALGLAGYLMLPNFWEIGVQTEKDYGLYDDRETRGNGLYRKPSVQSFYAAVESDSRQWIVVDLWFRLGSDSYGGGFWIASSGVEIKPTTNLTLEFQLAHIERNRERAWVANTLDPAIQPQPISIFARRSTREWDITTRGSFVFTRDLTLQLYFQLFFARGTFEEFERLAPADRFAAYSYNQPDFNRLSFNSNVVLRWEYLPGSTLYLVWSQARSGNHGTYATSWGQSLDNTFTLPAANVLLLKISYWWSL